MVKDSKDGRRNGAAADARTAAACVDSAKAQERPPSVSRGTGCSCIQSDGHPRAETLGGVALETGPLEQPQTLAVNGLKGL